MLIPVVRTLSEMVALRAQTDPSRTAFRFLSDSLTNERTLTYQELERHAELIAVWLENQPLGSRPVALLYPPGLDYITAFFGCAKAGIPAVPIYPPRNNRMLPRMQAILADCGAGAVLTDTRSVARIEQLLLKDGNQSNLVVLNTDTLNGTAANGRCRNRVSAESIALIQYTSGATRQPLGVCLTNANLLFNLARIREKFDLGEHSRGVSWLPPYHDMGLIGGILEPVYANFPATLFSPTSFLQRPLRWLETISRTKATVSGSPNFGFEACIERFKPEQAEALDLSCWETAFCGAEPVRARTVRRFAKVFEPYGFRESAFQPSYGLAEATLMVSGGTKGQTTKLFSSEHHSAAVRVSSGSAAVVSCGCGISGQKVMIVDPESRISVPDGGIGEIWVSGPSVAAGYWKHTVETEAAFDAEVADTGERGFLRTGDLGFLDGGNVFVVGRLKEVIIISGKNFYPHDIEEAVASSSPWLPSHAGAAFCVNVDADARLVVVQEINRSSQAVDTAAVRLQARRAVAEEFGIELHDLVLIRPHTLPRTSSGKPRRLDTFARYMSGNLSLIPEREQHL